MVMDSYLFKQQSSKIKMNLAIITTDEERFIETLKDYNISIVITNKSDSRAIETANKYGIKYKVIDHNIFSNREEHDLAIMKELDRNKIDLVILAGYRRLIKNKKFLASYGNKMINVHNSFLPNFPGPKPHELAFKADVKKSGYSIHYVDAVMDRGEIILQEEVNISKCKSVQEVYDIITEKACNGILRVVGMFAENKMLTSQYT